MRKLILATIILFSSLFVYSQTNKKFSYNTFLTIGGVTNSITSSIKEQTQFVMQIRDTTGRIHNLTLDQLYNRKTTKEDVVKLSLLFSGGAKVNFKLKSNLFVTSGIGLSAFKALRNISVSNHSRFVVIDTINGRVVLEGGYILPPLFTNTGGTVSTVYKPGVQESSSSYEIEQAFSFVTLDIPIGLQYQYRKFKFEQGVDISIILSTKINGKNPYEDPERSGPTPQFGNSIKNYFNYFGGVDYSVSKKIELGVIYKIGLTDALQASELNSLKVNSFGLRVSYNFK